MATAFGQGQDSEAVPDYSPALESAFELAVNRYLSSIESRPRLAGFVFSTRPEENIQGVGIGTKLVDGVRTSTRCVSLYVEHKFPKEAIPVDDLLPSEIESVPTDVIDLGGRFRSFPMLTPAYQRRQRPATPGCSVGVHLSGLPPGFVSAGTLGAIVKSNGQTYILSNSHVLADLGSLPSGTPVFQPGPADGGNAQSNDQIALLSREICRTGSDSTVDCALAELQDSSLVDPRFPAVIGKLASDTHIPPRDGMRVAKFGRTTGYTEGTVRHTRFACKIDYGSCIVRFRNQILIERARPRALVSRIMDAVFGDRGPFSAEGDSGALVIDTVSRKAVGLICGGLPSYTVANHLSEVFYYLGIENLVV